MVKYLLIGGFCFALGFLLRPSPRIEPLQASPDDVLVLNKPDPERPGNRVTQRFVVVRKQIPGGLPQGPMPAGDAWWHITVGGYAFYVQPTS